MNIFKSLFKPKGSIFEGLVDESGTGGVLDKGDTWTLFFSVLAYSENDSDLIEEKITVHKTTTQEKAKKLMNQIEPLSLLKFSGEIVQEKNRRKLIMNDLIDSNWKNEKFTSFIADRIKPVHFESSLFGQLTLERAYDWFSGTGTWCEHKVGINYSSQEHNAAKVEEFAKTVVSDQTEWSKKINSGIIKDLLNLKNTSWLEDDEPTISEQDFLDKISLETITFYDDGSFEFWYNDGDLFWGHSIQVDGSINDGIDRATIVG
ncbi:DUF2262 domain-containing protein [Paracrocinitomix mangrovi]|uniref:DUF2262 domain-containing protein n=1 Tax=Paracrocinitomix mangrovi TaxID=2862509 RepID=UPI001C8DB403|nr:DUF2262 domain-containing protein [Paracrocinitomix mangrovi]UKN03461.1 DUF2262 domain-containing protein [Paracrocinitomix mangrovi]